MSNSCVLWVHSKAGVSLPLPFMQADLVGLAFVAVVRLVNSWTLSHLWPRR